ncbi:MAG: glycosyltransferase [Phycisphaeraceae bacterium]|nr:glycosyltransferase [Phycisphaeraceae bacterium]
MSHSDAEARPHADTAHQGAARASGPRIVVASSGLGHVSRGIETWAASLGRALHDRGLCVTLCKGFGKPTEPFERVLPCARRDGSLAAWARLLLPSPLAWRAGLASAYGVEQATFAWCLVWFLRTWRADVLHVQDPMVALWAQRAKRLGLHRAQVVLAHGTEEPTSFLARLEHVQHLAPAHAERCREAGSWRSGWTVIPNFVDTATFHPGHDDDWRKELGIPLHAIVILTVAALKRSHKRLDVLIEAVARLRSEQPDLPVYLVAAGGREPDTDEVMRLAREQLADHARVLADVPRHRMASLYRSADIFALASLTEMMPIAVLEASASGLPCVVSDDPVLRWVAGPSALARDIRSTSSLACALLELATDTPRRQRAGAEARRHCVAQFGQVAVVDEIVSYYHAITGREQPRSQTPSPRPQPTPRVSVIIPTYDSAAWISDAIGSVLAQSSPPHEIIVIDDGSTDDTASRVAAFGPRVRYVRQVNRGVAAARNRGASMAEGELIAFLDADDVWHPRKLEIQQRALAASPSFALVGTHTFAWPGEVPDVHATALVHPVTWSQLVVRNRLTTSSVLVRRDALPGPAPFDEHLHGPEDLDLWLRIAERGRIGLIKAPLVGYRAIEDSLGRRPVSMEQGLQRIMAKLDARKAWASRPLLRRRALSHAQYSCAYMYSASGWYSQALRRLVSSMALYPLPFQPDEVRMPLARLRMLARVLSGWLLSRGTTRGAAP